MNQYTVIFEPGPIGMELEPGVRPNGEGSTCCRVQRFVDGGPNKPGAARAAGSIRLGDVVVSVNGSPVKTYEEVLSMLKENSSTREITFQSAWTDAVSGATSSKTLIHQYPGILRRTVRATSLDLSPVLDEVRPKGSLDLLSPMLEKISPAQKTPTDTKRRTVLDSTDSDGPAAFQAPRFVPRTVSLDQGDNAASETSHEERDVIDRDCSRGVVPLSPCTTNGDSVFQLGQPHRAFPAHKSDGVSNKSPTDKDLKRALINTRLQLETEKKDKQQLEKSKAATEHTLAQLEDDMANLRIEHKLLEEKRRVDAARSIELERALKEAVEARGSLSSELKTVRQLVHDKQDEIDRRRIEDDKMSRQMEASRRALSEKDSELKTQKENLRQTQDEAKRLKAEMRSMREALDQKASVAMEAKNGATENQDQSVQSIPSALSEFGHLKQDVANASSLKDEIFGPSSAEQNGSISGSLTTSNAVVLSSTQADQILLDQVQGALAEQEEITRRLSDELAETQQALDDARSRSKEVEDKLIERSVSLQAEVSCRNHEIEMLEQDLIFARGSINANSEQDGMVATQDELNDAKVELKAAKRKIRSLESSLAVLLKEKDSMLSTKRQVCIELAECRQKLEEKELQLLARNMQSEMDKAAFEDLEGKLSKKTDEIVQSGNTIELSRKHCHELNCRLKQVIDQAKKEEEILTSELIQSQEELAKVKRRNGEIENLLRSMRRNLAQSESRATEARDKLSAERESIQLARKRDETERGNIKRRTEELDEALKQSKQQVDQLESDKVGLRRELESLQRDLQDERQQVAASSSKFGAKEAALTEERDKILVELSEQKQAKIELVALLQEAQQDASNVQRELDLLERRFDEELQSAKHDIDVTSNKSAELAKEKDQVTKMLHEANEQARRGEKELRESKEALSKSLEAREGCEQRARELQEELQAKLAIETAEKDQIASALKTTEVALAEAVESLERKDTDLSTLRSVFAALSAENAGQKKEISEGEKAIRTLQAAISELQDEYVDSSETDVDISFFGMSRAELRLLCQDLTSSLAETEKANGRTRLELHLSQKRASSLGSELSSVTTKLKRIADANRSLEERIETVESKRQEADSEVNTLKSSLAEIQREFSCQITLRDSLSEKIETMREDAEMSSRLSSDMVDDLKQQIRVLKSRLSAAETRKEKLESETKELQANAERVEIFEARAKAAEEQLGDTRSQLSARNSELVRLRQNIDANWKTSSASLEAVRTECEDLRKRVSELELGNEKLNGSLRQHSEEKRKLLRRLEQAELDSIASAKQREETVAKLSEASEVVLEQKVLIKELEASKIELERLSAESMSQVKSLRSVLLDLEASEAATDDSLKDLEQLENRNSMLLSEQERLEQECASLRGELQHSRRTIEEKEGCNGMLRKQVDQLRESLDMANEESRSLRMEYNEIQAAFESCKCDVESKQVEIDRLHSRAKVLNSAISRMSTGDEVCEVEDNRNAAAAPDSLADRTAIAHLQSQLHTQDAKLKSLGETYRSQREVLVLTQSLEHQLLGFIEDVIGVAVNSFDTLYLQCQEFDVSLHAAHATRRFPALDLAVVVDDESSRLQQVAACLLRDIPLSRKVLHVKTKELNDWKRRRSMRVAEATRSPSTRINATPVSPQAVQVLNNMKQLLNEEVLSPHKLRQGDDFAFDPDYLQSMIHALESQIEVLLADLKSANDALRAKDQLFADMEELLSDSEKEKEELERRLAKQASSGERVHTTAESALVDDDSDLRFAGLIVEKFFENTELQKKSVAFRRWTSVASSHCAHEKQNHTAAELSHQLESTREKLSILKRHLKKSRMARSSPEAYLLRSISENCENV